MYRPPTVFVTILLFVFSNVLLAEGTKEIMQQQAHNGRIVLDPDFGGFAMVGANVADRLHIRINKVGEKIYYGLGTSIESFSLEQEIANDVVYRIVDPQGIVVSTTQLQPLSGNGFIDTYQKAVAGPKQFHSQGYDPLVLTANKTGDYYMEFYYPDADSGGRREFDYFDITVVSKNNLPVPGRVWSKAWMFTVSEKGGDPWDNPFYGKMYILSDDNIVTSVDFNGMQPFVFTLFANGTGVKNSGNPISDRQSVPAKLSYPQYKVFLNDPDSLSFPSGSFGDFAALTTVTGDGPPYCINVTTTMPGTIQILIELNGIKGYQVNSKDILLAKNVEAGLSCINWDGRDGNGNLLNECSDAIKFYVTYAGGLTHMPIYDVETNTNGFIVELVRPVTSSSHLALYWDDRNLLDFSIPPSNGCDGTLGCHKFGYFFGDSSTVNTWWYATSDKIDSLRLFGNGVALESVSASNQTCSNKEDGTIEVFGKAGTPPYLYALNSGAYQSDPLFDHLTEGRYTIRIKDQNNCTQDKIVNIGLNTFIKADFEFDTDGAYNDIAFNFTGEGASIFNWNFGDGESSSSQYDFHHFTFDTTYYVTLIAESGPPDYCIDSITKQVDIYPSLQVYCPNAFSPNGDNLNDTFRIFGVAIFDFEIYIFASNGAQIFHSNNLENSWDGTWNGEKLDHGVFAYVIRAKDRKKTLHEKKGTVTLVR